MSEETTPPPYRWVVLAVASLASTALSAAQIGLAAIAPLLAQTYGLSLAGVGWALGAVSLGMVLTLLPWGEALDRWGDRWPLACGMAGAALALALAAALGSLGFVLVCLVLSGMAGSVAAVGGGQAIISWFAPGERGIALGIRQMTVPVGAAIGAATLPRIAAETGISGVFVTLALFSSTAAAAAAVLMRNRNASRRVSHLRAGPAHVTDPRARRLGLAGGLLAIAQAAMVGFTVLYLHDSRGWSVEAAGTLVAVLELTGGMIRVFVGWRSDRLGRTVGPLRRIAALSAILLGGIAVCTGAPAVILYSLLVTGAIATMSWNGLVFTAAVQLARGRRVGSAFGLQATVLTLAAAVGPVLLGVAAEVASWSGLFALGALGALSAYVLLGPLSETERSSDLGLG